MLCGNLDTIVLMACKNFGTQTTIFLLFMIRVTTEAQLNFKIAHYWYTQKEFGTPSAAANLTKNDNSENRISLHLRT